MLAEDPHLTSHGFGEKDRLPLLLAAANEGELNLIARAAAIPPWRRRSCCWSAQCADSRSCR